MFVIRRTLKRTRLPVLIVLCLAALSASYAYADGALKPPATQVIGDPDAAVIGKLAVGTATPGNKALTVVGVIDFLGSGTVHNYFTQGPGNNMQINSNVDEGNIIGDPSKSQWKLVMGSSLDWFSIRRSPSGGTYNEDALFFINGPSGNVGIATVDTSNAAPIPFTPQARLHVLTASGDAVRGETAATDRLGVFGWATAPSGNTLGVVGQSNSTSGTGVMGYAPAISGTNYGVYGLSKSTDGTGVYGYAPATTGSSYGVYGRSDSYAGAAVYGYATSTAGDNVGVAGLTGSDAGTGVYGYAPTHGIAVYGDNSDPSGWAGYFTGDLRVGNNLYVVGDIYKSVSYFRIDHPLDPTKYLNHSAVESPDMMNIYNGMVTLDENGQAWVELPDWFEALNQDFRYQLTPIGAGMPDLHIAQGVQGNCFQIAGGAAGMEVSWQVTGIRHDAYAEAHRVPVEEDKPASGLSKTEPAVVPEALTNPTRSLPDPH